MLGHVHILLNVALLILHGGFVLQNSFVSGFSPEGMYLYWLDFSATGLSQQELRDKFSDAGIALSGGDFFFGGRESVYFRFNFATQKERVEWALGQIKKEFTHLKSIFDTLQKLKPKNCHLNTISMGMSGDYPLAIACGSTMVRIGSSIFGGR